MPLAASEKYSEASHHHWPFLAGSPFFPDLRTEVTCFGTDNQLWCSYQQQPVLEALKILF